MEVGREQQGGEQLPVLGLKRKLRVFPFSSVPWWVRGWACSTGFGHAGKARPQNMVEQDRRTGPHPESQDCLSVQTVHEKNPVFVKLLLFDSNKNSWIDTDLRGVQI